MRNQGPNLPVIASRLHYWLLSQEDNFRLPKLGGRNLFARMKPAGELSLIFFAHYQRSGNMPRPVRLLIDSMWNSYQHIQQTPSWPQLWGFTHENNGNSEIWQLFLHLEILQKKRFSFHNEIVDHLISLQDHNQQLSSTLDYTCELAGGSSALSSGTKEIVHLIEADKKGDLQPSGLYSLTHAVFYATRFGTRQLPVDFDKNALQDILLKGLVIANENKCLDVTAELLACLQYIKAPNNPAITAARRRLLSNCSMNQERPLKAANKFSKDKDYFSRHYHLVLTTLLAIN